LQLIRDVDTRWSSTFLMIERAIELQKGIDFYLQEQNRSSQLTDVDWTRLIKMQEILKLPHSYQQILSGEKTPTLCGTLPAFKGLLAKLKRYQMHDIEVDNIIEVGIDKLEDYQGETDDIPAYTLSICK
ncbi:hypothetical protein BC826DRAFT_920380, partial [Russula brevipes]